MAVHDRQTVDGGTGTNIRAFSGCKPKSASGQRPLRTQRPVEWYCTPPGVTEEGREAHTESDALAATAEQMPVLKADSQLSQESEAQTGGDAGISNNTTTTTTTSSSRHGSTGRAEQASSILNERLSIRTPLIYSVVQRLWDGETGRWEWGGGRWEEGGRKGGKITHPPACPPASPRRAVSECSFGATHHRGMIHLFYYLSQ